MLRYLRLFLIQLRASALLALQYRVEFFFQGLTILFWSFATFVPVLVVYDRSATIAGWTFQESLLVLGFFLLLKSVLEGAVNPSLIAVVEHIRKGTLDFVLLKPADAQFLVSTQKFEPSAIVGSIGAFILLGLGIRHTGIAPAAHEFGAAFVLLVCATALLYSLWILVVSAAFYVVRIDNLGYLLASVFDAARWPSSVFRGAFHVLFTFVIPLALMTTWPAESLLGRFDAMRLAGSLVGTAAFAYGARLVWKMALRRYTSASS